MGLFTKEPKEISELREKAEGYKKTFSKRGDPDYLQKASEAYFELAIIQNEKDPNDKKISGTILNAKTNLEDCVSKIQIERMHPLLIEDAMKGYSVTNKEMYLTPLITILEERFDDYLKRKENITQKQFFREKEDYDNLKKVLNVYKTLCSKYNSDKATKIEIKISELEEGKKNSTPKQRPIGAGFGKRLLNQSQI